LRGPDPATITEIVEAASRAPSVHNSQPWLWEYDGARLSLRAREPDWPGPGRDDARRDRHAAAGLAETRFPSGALLDHEPDGRPQQAWLLLFGTLQGLAIVPYTQPIEVDAARTGIEDPLLRGSANLQVILRIAVPPEGSPSTDHSRTSAASSHSSSSDSFSARSSSSRADSDASRS